MYSLTEQAPVSYTHLDVYKRQGIFSPILKLYACSRPINPDSRLVNSNVVQDLKEEATFAKSLTLLRPYFSAVSGCTAKIYVGLLYTSRG